MDHLDQPTLPGFEIEPKNEIKNPVTDEQTAAIAAAGIRRMTPEAIDQIYSGPSLAQADLGGGVRPSSQTENAESISTRSYQTVSERRRKALIEGPIATLAASQPPAEIYPK